jgi:DNA-binding transcriptional ArsR family regulator
LPAKGRPTKGSKGRKSGGAKGKGRGDGGPNQALVKALAHELRARILTILNERTASPVEMARELGEGLSHVSYHVKVLSDYKVITLVKTVPRRGAVEHYYRANSRVFLADRKWKAVAKSARLGMSSDLFGAVIDDAAAAMKKGTFDERGDRHFSWTQLTLDEKGWKALQKLLSETHKKVAKLNAEAGKRLAKSEDDPIPASVAMLGYEVPDSGAKKPAKPKAKASGGKRKGKKRR